MQQKTISRYLSGLDLLRFIMAVLVTILHLEPLSSCNNEINFLLTNWLTRIADGVFFCITSYLFFYRREINDLKWKDLFKYVKRIFIYYSVWTIMYMPLIISNFMTEKYMGMSVFTKIMIFVRRFIFIGSWTPLWFMPAAIIGMIITFVLLKLLKSKYIIFLMAAVSYIVISCFSTAWIFVGMGIIDRCRYIQKLATIYMLIFGSTTAGNIPYAFCFIALGMCIAYSEHTYKKYIDVIGLILSMLVLFGEVMFAQWGGAKQYGCMIFLIPAAYFCVNIFLCINLREREIYKYLRQISILVYPLHGLVSGINLENSMVNYLVVMSVTILFSILILCLSRKVVLLKLFY
ncbi:MAG: acyltransferase [Ruminococcus flavefaciens]|nr:acyltransferase [Ruminococcus flavefaciens]